MRIWVFTPEFPERGCGGTAWGLAEIATHVLGDAAKGSGYARRMFDKQRAGAS